MLTNKYLQGIPADSRAAKPHGFLKASEITEERLQQIRKLNEIAHRRKQSLARMALAWLLKDKRITTVLIGASSVEQLNDNLACLEQLEFSSAELDEIEQILKK